MSSNEYQVVKRTRKFHVQPHSGEEQVISSSQMQTFGSTRTGGKAPGCKSGRSLLWNPGAGNQPGDAPGRQFFPGIHGKGDQKWPSLQIHNRCLLSRIRI